MLLAFSSITVKRYLKMFVFQYMQVLCWHKVFNIIAILCWHKVFNIIAIIVPLPKGHTRIKHQITGSSARI